VAYKVHMLATLSPIEWSQAAWRLEGRNITLDCERELIHKVLLEHLPKDGLIVDAGCGTAKWLMYLRPKGYRLVGIDISHEACAIARDTDPKLQLMVSDTRRAAIRDHSVDCVVSLGVVEHEEAGPMAGLRELHRMLKPGGLLIVDTPYNNLVRRLLTNPLHSYKVWRRRRDKWSLAFSEYRFTERELRNFLVQANFEPLVSYPNDLLPPRNMGMWVDYHNIVFNPFCPPKLEELFVLKGLLGSVVGFLVRRAPWTVSGEVVIVARARPQ
jgi:SAM-dependent methyltransferase